MREIICGRNPEPYPQSDPTMYSLNSVKKLLALTCLAILPSLAIGQTVVVMPYVQPGAARSNSDKDSKVLHWFSEQKPADYTVEYRVPEGGTRCQGSPHRPGFPAELKVPERKPKGRQAGRSASQDRQRQSR